MLMERYAEARPYLLDALERERSADGSDRHVVALHRANLGFSVGMLDDPVQGAAELEQAIADIQALAPLDHALLATWIERRIRLALHLGDTTTALAWLERLAWAASQVAELDKAWWVGRVDTIRGAALLAAARPAEALLPLARASDALARHRSTDFVIPVEQQLLLAKAHADSGDAARARSLAASARASLQALPYPPSRLLQMARQLPQ